MRRIRRRDIVRMEDDQVVLANRYRADKELVAEAAIGVAAVGICLAAAASNRNHGMEDPGMLSGTAAAGGLMVAGAAAGMGICVLEANRQERHDLKQASDRVAGDDMEPVDFA